jgi:hypothetical protein
MKRIVLLLAGCAANLPSYPVNIVAKPAAEVFTGDKCRVRIEPLVFDAATRWLGMSEAEFVATLKPDARQKHEGDKPGTNEMFFKQININERDYIGDRGKVTTGTSGDEPLVLRPRVNAVGQGGALDVDYLLFEKDRKVAEWTLTTSNVGYGFGQQMRTATIPQAWSVLKYLADHFACKGPARVAD